MGRLSASQRHMLAACSAEWQDIWDVGAWHTVNRTLSNLEKRGLVVLRSDPVERGFLKWQVRLSPAKNSVSGPSEASAGNQATDEPSLPKAKP